LLQEGHTLESNSRNVLCVCEHCGKSSSDDSRIEINFLEKSIYWYCKECKKMNKLIIDNNKNTPPLPKMRLM
jgi:hypothetical protein